MKKILLILIIAITTIILTGTSCGSGSKNGGTIEPFPIDTVNVYKSLLSTDSVEKSMKLRGIPVVNAFKSYTTENEDVYVKMDLTILDQNPKITSNLLAFAMFNLVDWGFTHTRDSLVSEKFNPSGFTNCTTQAVINKFSDWVGEEFYAKSPEILPLGCGFNMHIEIYPVFLNDEYVTYCKDAEYYTGGAHGNYSRFLQTYNIKTGETLDLEDIIKPDKMEEFRKVVVDHMAYSYPIFDGIKTVEEYLDSLNRWRGATNLGVVLGAVSPDSIERINVENYPVNDPAITEVGLVISYEKYFITPGAYGCPTIVISYDEIKNCLQPPFNQYKTIMPK